jgi:hypothetical protein
LEAELIQRKELTLGTSVTTVKADTLYVSAQRIS